MSQEEILDLDDEPISPQPQEHQRLVKRQANGSLPIERRVKQANFRFLEDDEDPYIIVSEDSYEADETVLKQARRELGVVDEDDALRAAFDKLVGQQWRVFLADPYMKRLFSRAYQCLYSFNNGSVHAQVEELWHLKWDGKLEITRLRRCPERICYLCAKCRRVTHSCLNASGETVYLGPDCYDKRFSYLLELVDVSQSLAAEWASDSNVNIQFLRSELERVLLKFGDGNRDMVKCYAN